MTVEPATVLVVEDDEGTRNALMELLRLDGYRVLGAADGKQALAVCEEDPPNLILLDLMMPVMDGWQFLEQWRARGSAARCHIVLLSGLGFIPDAPGVSDFLPKPVDARKLRACVRRLLL
jgi:CheY-like chemotaxis protein